jgi:hypothetical protein
VLHRPHVHAVQHMPRRPREVVRLHHLYTQTVIVPTYRPTPNTC